ncbi:MAG: CHAT domain-containing protein [Bacteroidota bacterium]|nr:CHAT domain-containing protein [Bacteroidota bacterium]
MSSFRSLRISLLIGSVLVLSRVAAIYDPHKELRAIVSGDMKGVIQRLSSKLEDPAVRNDTLLLARTLEMLGEQYFRISDIDEAKRYWDEAFELRIAAFGSASPEAGVGLAWLARYQNYMSAPQWDHTIKAEEIASRALELVERKSNVLPMEKVLAWRERAYAYKVVHGINSIGRTDKSPTEPSEASRPMYRRALAIARGASDTIWTAQILHDIGNTFTDQAIPSRGDSIKLRMVVDSALWYYSRSINLMQQCGLGNSEPVMMDHLTTGLLHQYAYQDAGHKAAITNFCKALRVLFDMQRVPTSSDIYQFNSTVPNKAQVLELMSFISNSYGSLWYADKQGSYLDSAIHVIEAAVPYWEALVKEYESSKLHMVTSSYAHSPFEYANRFHLDRYKQRGENDDLVKAMVHMERGRNVKAQRDRLTRGLPALQLLEKPVMMEDLTAPEGTLILEYLSGNYFCVVVIDESGPTLIDLGPIHFNSSFGVGKFNEFPVNEISADREVFHEKALQWYRHLLQDALRGRDEKELVIIPYGTLVHLPFEALLIDTLGGSDRFVGKEYSIRYAPDLWSAIAKPRMIEPRAEIALANGEGTSELPFAMRYARSLANELKCELDTTLFSYELDLLLREEGILHMATHARAEGLPDTDPYILLNDRAWSEKDIPWGKVERDLIVLAACSSGSGRVYLGEGAQSIGNALIQAGAGAVIHTLWPVDDRSTNEILHHMYSAMLNGEKASTALRMAKTRFITEHRNDGLDDPFYWSGIVLAGTDVLLKRERPVWLLVISISALLLIGLYVHKRSRSSRARALN